MSDLAFIIEDDEDLSTIFADALETVGYQVEQIKDGLKAQQRLREEVPSSDPFGHASATYFRCRSADRDQSG